MSEKRRKRHSPEQIVRKLRDADAMLNVVGREWPTGEGVVAASEAIGTSPARSRASPRATP
jgi:hypothetical protein